LLSVNHTKNQQNVNHKEKKETDVRIRLFAIVHRPQSVRNHLSICRKGRNRSEKGTETNHEQLENEPIREPQLIKNWWENYPQLNRLDASYGYDASILKRHEITHTQKHVTKKYGKTANKCRTNGTAVKWFTLPLCKHECVNIYTKCEPANEIKIVHNASQKLEQIKKIKNACGPDLYTDTHV